MVTELRPTPSGKEKFCRVSSTFLLNLIFLSLLGLMIHTPALLRVTALQNAQLQEYAGENGPAFLIAFFLIGLVGLTLSLLWKPTNRAATIILCLINIIVIALCALILLGLISSFSGSALAVLRVIQMLFVLAIGALNIGTLIYLDILGAITGGERK